MCEIPLYNTTHSVAFKEASLTVVCRKLYWEQFNQEHILDQNIVDSIYTKRNQPPHYEFIGEIVEEIEGDPEA